MKVGRWRFVPQSGVLVGLLDIYQITLTYSSFLWWLSPPYTVTVFRGVGVALGFTRTRVLPAMHQSSKGNCSELATSEPSPLDTITALLSAFSFTKINATRSQMDGCAAQNTHTHLSCTGIYTCTLLSRTEKTVLVDCS